MFRQQQTSDGQRGVVLLLSLIALLLISAVGAAILFMAAAESSLVGSQRVSARTFYSTMGGLEETRYRMMPAILDAQGGLNEPGTQIFALLPVVPPPGVAPTDVLYTINTNNPATPANFNAFAQLPANDIWLAAEVPAAVNLRAVASIQPNAGGNAAIPWQWVRINLKTELAANQDLNRDGFLDQVPVFLYSTRQYRATDLQVYDPDGAGPSGPGWMLPPPWGPPPPLPTQSCAALICASPVYMLTSLTQIALPAQQQTTSRLMRAEVAVSPPFMIDAGVLSQPGINVTGNMDASGRDICDPDCTAEGFIFAGQAGFGTQPTPVGSLCNTVQPLRSAAPPGQNDPGPNSASTDPTCAGPNCVCGGGGNPACIETNTATPYDIDDIINELRPMATRLQEPVDSYYPQTGGGNLSCDASGCQAQKLQLGLFPFLGPGLTNPDPVNGTNADPMITYVDGNFKCTSGCSGAGILIVDGDLEFNASMAFYGIIIVRGDVSVLGGGNPPTDCNIYGALITGGGIETKVGGGLCYQYNSCAQRDQFRNAPLLSLSFREVPSGL